jgi:hydroxyacid-oxoacid transhydrogenase
MSTCLYETAFSMDTSSIKFGPGVTTEVGWEMKRLGCRRVMVLTDPRVAQCEPVEITLAGLGREHIDAVLFDQVHVEPTDVSFQEAIKVATDGNFDGYVAVGGGSSMDTAKAANLYATYPAGLLAYVNAPIGEGRPVPGPLRPLVAVPTTTGTGSETTGVAIFDLLEMRAKTGIAHRALRPTVGLVDPNNTRTLPRTVIACSGFDVLCHGIESYTALPYHQRPAPEHPGMRPAYQGSNPISDVWALRAIEMVARNIRRPLDRAGEPVPEHAGRAFGYPLCTGARGPHGRYLRGLPARDRRVRAQRSRVPRRRTR